MYPKTHNVTLLDPAAKSQGLTRVTAGLTRLPAGLRVKTHIRAGGTCTRPSCVQY